MPIDKSWMRSGRSTHEYFTGVANFIDYTYKHLKYDDMKIYYPCIKCSNRDRRVRDEVHQHLLFKGIRHDYTRWYLHGEDEDNDSAESDSRSSNGNEVDNLESIDDMHGLIKEVFKQEPNGDAGKFYKLLEEAEEPLLPTTKYGAKKIVKDLGLHYEKIDACKKDCVIYYKEHENLSQCPTCKISRWKSQGWGGKEKGKKVPWKVLRYFSLTPRLQRLFMSSKIAADMRWHYEERVKDGVLRHPTDSEAWKSLDRIHESFGNESCNVRLGLATDGFNPFGNMSVKNSLWPILLFPYNLPPWMLMKEPYLYQEKKDPGQDIDVYMRPLIYELQDLWEIGIETYDISKADYELSNDDKKAVFQWLMNLKVPNGYSANISRGVNATKCTWEANVAGPVQYRWMYLVERYLHKLKSYVRNKAHPVGSIGEGYLADECVTFCSRYFSRVETIFSRTERNYDGGQPSSDASELSIFSASAMARKGRSRNTSSTNEQRELLRSSAVRHASVELSHDNEVQETQETCSETQPSNTQGLSARKKKKKGRWKAKGGKGKGMLIEIYKGCIVTKEAARNIGVHFKQEIKGAWDQSKRNKSNLEKSTIVHTTGSVPTAKYQKMSYDCEVGDCTRYHD
ncbi:unnamed protein product [Prunus armeniaca]